MQEFEKDFVKWTIAVLKKNNKSVEEMITNLRPINPELAQYATEISSKVRAFKADAYLEAFTESVKEAIIESDNPEQELESFLKALPLSPGIRENISIKVFKAIWLDKPKEE